MRQAPQSNLNTANRALSMKLVYRLGFSIPALALTLAGPQLASADNCYTADTAGACTGGVWYECTVTKCCEMKVVPRRNPNGQLEWIEKEECKVTERSCRPTSETCQKSRRGR